MSNILTIPASGSIYFDSGTAGSSTVPDLTGSAVSLSYDGNAGLNITSYNALSADRFSVDGSNGRLFSISDSLTGTIFSVNDAAGLPIIEVESDTVDTVTIGTYGTNALVVKDDKVGIGTTLPNEKLTVVGNISASGNIEAATADIPIITSDVIMNGTENTMPNQTLDGGDASVITLAIAEELYGWNLVPFTRYNSLTENGGSNSIATGSNWASVRSATSGGLSSYGGFTMLDGFARNPLVVPDGYSPTYAPFYIPLRTRIEIANTVTAVYGDGRFWFWLGTPSITSLSSEPVDDGYGFIITVSGISAALRNGGSIIYGPTADVITSGLTQRIEVDIYNGENKVKVSGQEVSSVSGGKTSSHSGGLLWYAYSELSDGTTSNYYRGNIQNLKYRIVEV